MAQLIQAVEHTEYIDAIFCCTVNKLTDYIFRIVGISYRISPTGQHLEQNVRSCLSHLTQSFPRAFIEETISYVECCAAPVFKCIQVRYMACSVVNSLHNIMGSYTGSQQGLMGITISGIHNLYFVLFLNPAGESFRSQLLQELSCASRCFQMVSIQTRCRFKIRLSLMASICIAVNGDFADVIQNTGSAVAYNVRVNQQFRMTVDIVYIAGAFLEVLGAKHVLEEINICLNPGNTEFIKAAEHLAECASWGQCMNGNLYQQGVIVWSNDSTGVSRARIETNARTTAGTVGNKLAGIRHEVISRIFGGNTALESNALVPDIFLLTNTYFRIIKAIAFCNHDLGSYNIYVRNHFGYGMFYLDTRINFDEVEILFVLVYQEFDSTCVDVVNVLHELNCSITDALAQFLWQGPCRSHFNNLLMTALNGAVTFEKVYHMAMFIPHNLHFNVLRVHDALFKINIFIAKGHLRFRLSTFKSGFQIFHAVYITHTASAAAVDSLNHNRQAHLFSKCLNFFIGGNRAITAWNHRNIGLLSLNAGIDLIAEHNQMFYMWSDENNAFFFATLSQFCIFSQETIAWMNSIYIMLLSYADNIFNIEIGFYRTFTGANQIRFVRTVSVKGQNILFRINSYGTNAQFLTGSEYADSDFSSVCNEYLVNLFHISSSVENPQMCG